jgi:hypothetical protein
LWVFKHLLVGSQILHPGFIASEQYGDDTPKMLEHLEWVDCWQNGRKRGVFMQVISWLTVLIRLEEDPS